MRVCLTDSPRDHAIMHYTVVPLRYFVLRLRFDSKYGVSEELLREIMRRPLGRLGSIDAHFRWCTVAFEMQKELNLGMVSTDFFIICFGNGLLTYSLDHVQPFYRNRN